MNKVFFFLLIILINSCSFDKNSSFWSSSKKIELEKNYKNILKKDEALNQSLNPDLKINIDTKSGLSIFSQKKLNNDGRLNFNGNLKKISKYKFSKIKNFQQYESTIAFNKKDIIFFDNKGTILKFGENSKLIWKKNYYSKSEKKLNPILQFANNENQLIVADNIAKYYLLNLETGDLIWSKNNLAPFNSQIKIHNDKFFIVDFSNTLRCFSLKNGKELWNIKTENTLIRSQKKLSILINKNTVYFNNSLGDITAVNISKGQIIWQIPTQNSLIYQSAFSLETSDLVSDGKTIFLSNNRNQFFSIDMKSGTFNWENKINSNLRLTIIDNLIFTVSMEGYLIIMEKNTGNILRVTDIFNNIKQRKRNEIKPIGFIVGLKNIYLSTSNGRILVIDIESGVTVSTLKVDSEKVSRPFVVAKNLFVVKDDAIIRLN